MKRNSGQDPSKKRIVKEGILEKRGSLVTSWRFRYFALYEQRGGLMLYYLSKYVSLCTSRSPNPIRKVPYRYFRTVILAKSLALFLFEMLRYQRLTSLQNKINSFHFNCSLLFKTELGISIVVQKKKEMNG